MKSGMLVLLALLASMVVGLSCDCGDPDLCVETLSALNLTETSATLHGRLTNNIGALKRVGFTFWQTGIYLEELHPKTLTCEGQLRSGDFYYDVSNLQPGTQYSFRAWAGLSEPEEFGDEVVLTTDAPAATLPTVTTGDASDVTYQSATLHGTVVSMGTASSLTVEFELRTASSGTTIYTTLETLQAPGDFTLVVSALTPETTYYFKAVAKDLILGLQGSGSEESFTTTKGAGLTILSSQLVTDGATFARVTGQAQNTGTTPLGYAQIAVYFKDASGAMLVGQHAIEKQNLALGEIWTWEVAYLGTDFSNVASHEATVVLALPP